MPDGEQRDAVAEFSQIAMDRVDGSFDWVKIFATTCSAEDLTANQSFFYPEIRAATEVAHAGGLRVALHSYGLSS